ncbi:MAG: hypothetical protein P4L50_23470 [Anaerolineaceae bacterium]|nr:hypothetical protein [Anaerolineaceae bacterium]
MSSVSSQILEILSRSSRGGHEHYEVMNLERAWQKLDKDQRWSFSRYIPIRLITLTEVCFKSNVKQLIDFDSEHKKRGLLYIAKIPSKQIAEILFHVDQDSFTLGDIVSSTITCSSIEDIISTMNSIYGENFKSDVCNSRERWLEDKGVYKQPFIENFNVTIGFIARLFKIRHILVHEEPKEKPYSEDEFESFFEHVKFFTQALSWLVTFEQFGAVPRTQSAMNTVSWERASETLKILSEKYGEPAEIPEALKTFNQHDVWKYFVHLAADARSGLSLGRPFAGSISPLLYASEVARLNEWRIMDLEKNPDRFSQNEISNYLAKVASNDQNSYQDG